MLNMEQRGRLMDVMKDMQRVRVTEEDRVKWRRPQKVHQKETEVMFIHN